MLRLDYRDPRSIDQQLRDGLRRLIVSGAFSPGEALPAAGDVAAALVINPEPVRRAYRALESEGCVRLQGERASVAPEAADLRRRDLLARFDRTAGELFALGESRESLIRRLERRPHREEVIP